MAENHDLLRSKELTRLFRAVDASEHCDHTRGENNRNKDYAN
jgi:hypothetical protein